MDEEYLKLYGRLYCPHCKNDISRNAIQWLSGFFSVQSLSESCNVAINTVYKWSRRDTRVIRRWGRTLFPPYVALEYHQKHRAMEKRLRELAQLEGREFKGFGRPTKEIAEEFKSVSGLSWKIGESIWKQREKKQGELPTNTKDAETEKRISVGG